jgi:hypothetical protein
MKFYKKYLIAMLILGAALVTGCRECMIIGIIDACYDEAVSCYPSEDFEGIYQGRASINYPGPITWGDKIILELNVTDGDDTKCAEGLSLTNLINGKIKILGKNVDGSFIITSALPFQGLIVESLSDNSNIPKLTSFVFDIYDGFGSQKLFSGDGKLTRSSKFPYQIDLKINDMYSGGGKKESYFTEIQVLKYDGSIL